MTLGVTGERQFKNQTSARGSGTTSKTKWLVNARGPKIGLIDASLKALDRIGDNGNQDQQMGALRQITKSCAYWLRLKHAKNTAIATHRRPVITRVMGEAIAALKQLNPAEGAYAEKKCRAIESGLVVPQHVQNHRTGGVKNIGKFGGGHTKSLDGNYRFEREFYLDNGKGNRSAAAGAVHGQIITYNALHGTEFDWDSLDRQTYDMIYNEFVRTGGNDHYNNSTAYLPKRDRMQYMVLVDGGICSTPTGANYSTTGGNNIHGSRLSDMWAMDRYGNLFVKSSQMLQQAAYFNHSSFCAGNDVICAGTIVIDDGMLVYIDNQSGHYKPDRDQLLMAIGTLHHEGGIPFILNTVRVGLMGANGVTNYEGNSFLANVNVQPWDHQYDVQLGLTQNLVAE